MNYRGFAPWCFIIHCVVVHVVIVYLHYSHFTLNEQLRRAAGLGSTEEVVRLLGQGAYPNYQDPSGWTAVHCACIYNKHHSLSVILKKKNININLRTNISNETPLHFACEYGSLKCVQILLDYGADTG